LTQRFREHDVVEIVRLATDSREFHGTDGVARAPAVGDVATILMICDPENGSGFMLEMVDDGGYTVWVATFSRDELRLVWTPGHDAGRA
jgi:hypothetical protein